MLVDKSPKCIKKYGDIFPIGKAAAPPFARLYNNSNAKVGGLANPTMLAEYRHHCGHGLTAREPRYLMDRERAVVAGDALWQRTEPGLPPDAGQRQDLRRFWAGDRTR